MSNKNIKRNFLYSAGYQLLLIILPFITAPYISRTLGSYQIGVYSYSNAYANYFFMFALLGVTNYGNRTIAGVRDNKLEAEKTFWEIYSFQIIMALMMLLFYIFFSFFVINENNTVFFVQSFFVLSAAFDVNWACFALENFKLTAIRSAIIRILMAVCVFIFVKDASDLVFYALILSLGQFISNLVIWPFIKKTFTFRKPSWEGVIKHIKPNLILFVPILAVSIYNVMDKLMLEFFSTKNEVGYYALAERIVLIPNTLLLALDNVVMPKMSNLFKNNKDSEAFLLMDKIMIIIMFFSSAFTFGLASIAPEFTVWFYGNEYVRSGLFVLLLSPIVLFKGFAGALRTQYIIPKSKDSWFIISLISGALVNLLANLILIPRLQGVGAIIGTVLAEMTVAFLQFYYCRKELPIKKYLTQATLFVSMGILMYILLINIPLLSSITIMDLIFKIFIGCLFYIFGHYIFLKLIKREMLIYDIISIFKK